MSTLAKAFSPSLLIALLQAMARAAVEIRNQDDPRLTVEMALLGLFLGGETAPAVTPAAAPAIAPREPAVKPAVTSEIPPAAERPKAAPSDMPVAGVQASTGEDLLELVKSSWPNLLDALARGKKMMARAYLLPAKIGRASCRERV